MGISSAKASDCRVVTDTAQPAKTAISACQ
ncbi:MAG: hypothetical protein JWN52_597 [Actinomycetia bacterium]|nr:hypothetical protein [Actinomycetes bacterium]